MSARKHQSYFSQTTQTRIDTQAQSYSNAMTQFHQKHTRACILMDPNNKSFALISILANVCKEAPVSRGTYRYYLPPSTKSQPSGHLHSNILTSISQRILERAGRNWRQHVLSTPSSSACISTASYNSTQILFPPSKPSKPLDNKAPKAFFRVLFTRFIALKTLSQARSRFNLHGAQVILMSWVTKKLISLLKRALKEETQFSRTSTPRYSKQ